MLTECHQSSSKVLSYCLAFFDDLCLASLARAQISSFWPLDELAQGCHQPHPRLPSPGLGPHDFAALGSPGTYSDWVLSMWPSLSAWLGPDPSRSLSCSVSICWNLVPDPEEGTKDEKLGESGNKWNICICFKPSVMHLWKVLEARHFQNCWDAVQNPILMTAGQFAGLAIGFKRCCEGLEF